MLYPHTSTGLLAGFIAIPFVVLFVWLFNSYKLGKFGKAKQSPVNTNSKFYSVVILAFIIVMVCILSFLLFR